MKRIIVNADDFGISQIVTTEIERQIMAGRVTSTTIMANGTSLDKVKIFAAHHPEISFGVHLCLSEFDSLTKSVILRQAGITDEEGKFIYKAVFRLNDYGHTVRQAILAELNAQIDVVESLGFPISHADSHHHVHTIYQLKELFADVLRKRGIKKIRLGGDFRNWRTRLHFKQWMQRIALNRYYSTNFTTADYLFSYSDFLDSGCHFGEGKVVELMCHPGHVGPQYKKEMAILEESSLPKEVRLISYNELY